MLVLVLVKPERFGQLPGDGADNPMQLAVQVCDIMRDGLLL